MNENYKSNVWKLKIILAVYFTEVAKYLFAKIIVKYLHSFNYIMEVFIVTYLHQKVLVTNSVFSLFLKCLGREICCYGLT